MVKVMLDKIRKYIVDEDERIIYFNRKVYISNFSKILEIGSESISVKSKNGIFIIIGENLSLLKLLDNEVLISGKIKNIEVFDER